MMEIVEKKLVEIRALKLQLTTYSLKAPVI
jgi:hypothetical protein